MTLWTSKDRFGQSSLGLPPALMSRTHAAKSSTSIFTWSQPSTEITSSLPMASPCTYSVLPTKGVSYAPKFPLLFWPPTRSSTRSRPFSQTTSNWLRWGDVQPQSKTAERFPGNHKVPAQATMVSTLLKVTCVHMTFSGRIQPKAHRIADKGYQPWSPRHPMGSRDLSVRPLPPCSHASSGALKVKAAVTLSTSPSALLRSFSSICLVLVEWYHMVPSIHCRPLLAQALMRSSSSLAVPPMGFSE
mmetsp:Transcript_88845/g.212099  ORF Transcript_88845/g.212099 Transcript_88845/m.212099 type:complete len:245 (+) Transcript_88845:169-903(+)